MTKITDPCEELIPALVRAADGSLAELPESDRVRLDVHLASCAACRESLAGQVAMREALTSLAATPVTSHVGVRVMAELREQTRSTGGLAWLDTLDWRRWTWRLVPVVAALALVAANVARTDASAQTSTPDPAAARPVSSALVTGEVAGTDLLSLLLSTNADETLPAATSGGGQ
jgi:anti-sigma factor RsiW